MAKAAVQALPDVPSELIRLAIRDLNAMEKTKGYVVDMEYWHGAHNEDGHDGNCAVCFAGSVMANSLNVQRKVRTSPQHFPTLIERKLSALDDFRTGQVDDALETLKIDNDSDVPNRSVADYHNNKAQFKRDMRELADDLEAVGM